ncbi:Chromodomain protein [Phytophthora megakarya]|uniref:Chromodomain protein n=1 Tax=Phytophthora megakarya TaxID=4795 RepID=A0A225X0Y3_9STRA|nr:Chromodomain protein [Phytophthora megakarya]
MDWKSSKVDMSKVADPDPMEQTMANATRRKKEDEVEAEPDAAAIDMTKFEVTYQCLPEVGEVSEEEEVTELTSRQMQYLDVLLQTDERGLGLCVGVQAQENGGQVVMVQGFRRLSEDDVAPAEACGKIRVGDILQAVDGEQVASLQQLHEKLKGRLGRRRKFVLLRFLRPLVKNDDSEAVCERNSREIENSNTNWSEIDELLHGNSQVATLIRQLATRNQVLQEQLIASRLKQEEQNIQLDQLHALYAKTQAEGLPLFSLSKSIRPFSRKASAAQVVDGLEKLIPTKVQTEVIEAVNVEYSRLRQEFQLQLLLDKRELERKYAEKAQSLEEAMSKKMEMLEVGFQQTLKHFVDDHHYCCDCRSVKMEPNDGILLDDYDFSDQCGKTTNSAKLVETKMNTRAGHTLRQILELLEKYEEVKHTRAATLQNINSKLVQ